MTSRRTICITGAGSGIGAGLAERAAADGWSVLVTDRDAARAHAVAAGIADRGGVARALAVDVTDDASVAALAAHPIDVLVNNAGLQHVASLEEFPQEAWSHLVDVLLHGAVRATRAVLPGMRARGFGRVVHIGSIHALVASPYKSAYVAAKHGLLGFAKTLALETADTDITVNTICPSYVRTPLVDGQIAAQAARHGIPEEAVIRDIMLAPMPKGVFITIDELWATTAFLISDGARNITGQAIALDGGWTAR